MPNQHFYGVTGTPLVFGALILNMLFIAIILYCGLSKYFILHNSKVFFQEEKEHFIEKHTENPIKTLQQDCQVFFYLFQVLEKIKSLMFHGVNQFYTFFR